MNSDRFNIFFLCIVSFHSRDSVFCFPMITESKVHISRLKHASERKVKKEIAKSKHEQDETYEWTINVARILNYVCDNRIHKCIRLLHI